MLAVVEPLSPDQFTRDLGNSFQSVRDTLSHLHGSEWMWLSRSRGVSPASRLPHDRFPDLACAPRGLTPKLASARWSAVSTPRSRARDRVSNAGPSAWLLPHVAHAAPHGEPRDVSPRAGDDDAATARRGAAEIDGSGPLLSGAGRLNLCVRHAPRHAPGRIPKPAVVLANELSPPARPRRIRGIVASAQCGHPGRRDRLLEGLREQGHRGGAGRDQPHESTGLCLHGYELSVGSMLARLAGRACGAASRARAGRSRPTCGWDGARGSWRSRPIRRD
jgi:DinB family